MNGSVWGQSGPDLSGYITSAQLTSALSPYALSSALSSYATTASLDGYELKPVVQYVTPTNGQTVTVNPATTMLIIDPATLLLALTITLPATPSRGEGHRINICSTQAITVVTMNSGASTLLSGLGTLALGGNAAWVWRQNKYFRCT